MQADVETWAYETLSVQRDNGVLFVSIAAPPMNLLGPEHRLGVGYAHRGTKILAIADETTVTVPQLQTGEILSTHTIDPTKTYWRNTQRAPGRWPGTL